MITAVHCAPGETILRRAKGGDNWPISWGDDGDLYTAYGDGNGFEPAIDVEAKPRVRPVGGRPGELHRRQHPLVNWRANWKWQGLARRRVGC